MTRDVNILLPFLRIVHQEPEQVERVEGLEPDVNELQVAEENDLDVRQ